MDDNRVLDKIVGVYVQKDFFTGAKMDKWIGNVASFWYFKLMLFANYYCILDFSFWAGISSFKEILIRNLKLGNQFKT